MGGRQLYDDKQRAEFIELAQNIGIGRSIRELGYPSFPTAQAWMRAAGVEPNRDTAMQAVKAWHTFYQVEDLLVVIDEGISVAQDMLATASTPDDVKRLSESLQKLVNTRLTLEGKSTSIIEKREMTQQDLEIAELLREQRLKDTPGVEDNTVTHETLVETD